MPGVRHWVVDGVTDISGRVLGIALCMSRGAADGACHKASTTRPCLGRRRLDAARPLHWRQRWQVPRPKPQPRAACQASSGKWRVPKRPQQKSTGQLTRCRDAADGRGGTGYQCGYAVSSGEHGAPSRSYLPPKSSRLICLAAVRFQKRPCSAARKPLPRSGATAKSVKPGNCCLRNIRIPYTQVKRASAYGRLAVSHSGKRC